MKNKIIVIALAGSIPTIYWLYSSQKPAVAAQEQGTTASADSTQAADRQAFFGDLHNHTSISLDAYMMGARASLDDAYKFARGETVSYMGHSLKRDVPLDFIAVTDHAEQMGFESLMEDPNSNFGKTDIAKKVKSGQITPSMMIEIVQNATLSLELTAIGPSIWRKSIDAANKYYQPGLFTTFVGYEWSSTPGGQNMHRNIIYRGNDAPFPFSALDSMRPEDLWNYLEKNRRRGYEALAIPHNANASNGLMYDWVDSDGHPIDEAYAQRRLVNEPLSEIAQNKGQSETHPSLSSEDEFSTFEIFDTLLAKTKVGGISKPSGSYIRDAYGRGLEIAQRTGANPYKFGVAGGTDEHSGFSTSNERAYAGDVFRPTELVDRENARRNLGQGDQSKAFMKATMSGAGALTGIWAEHNTRESLYAALRRKETFATSGTRMKVRMFAGWNYPKDLTAKRGWVQTAYSSGVAMGGDLPARPHGTKVPTFIISALKDPDGANLDRAQIIKVWLDGTTRRERVFDIALSGNRRVVPATGKAPPVGNTVDLRTATYTNSIGSAQFLTMWTDPTFNAAQTAVYYLRVLEIPTPRWTTILAAKHQLPLPANTAPTLQERAWSSPIWYTPTR